MAGLPTIPFTNYLIKVISEFSFFQMFGISVGWGILWGIPRLLRLESRGQGPGGGGLVPPHPNYKIEGIINLINLIKAK